MSLTLVRIQHLHLVTVVQEHAAVAAIEEHHGVRGGRPGTA
jgi:hypothetical protein